MPSRVDFSGNALVYDQRRGLRGGELAGDGAEYPFGIWNVNPGRSIQPYPDKFVVRFQPHAKGEVFTVDRVGVDGRATSASSILYLDGKPHGFQDFACTGTQSSERVNSRTS